MRRVSPSLLFVVVLLLNGPPPRAVQIQLPETPAGRQCAAWQQAFNGSDREAYRAFLQKNFPSRAQGTQQSRYEHIAGQLFGLRACAAPSRTRLDPTVDWRAFGRRPSRRKISRRHYCPAKSRTGSIG